MSASIGGLGNLVLSLFNSGDTSSGASGLLSTINGSGSTASNVNPVTALQTAEANSTKDIAQTAADPVVARDIATFRSKVAAAKTPADLLKDPTVLKVLLTANGLGDQAQYPALAQKALLSDTTNTSSLANTLSDTTWKSVAATYDFAHKGLSIIQNPKVLNTLANGYAEVTWRNSLDATTPGLSEALSFKDSASGITSVDQILGSATLRKVVTTALGIPQEIAYQDLGAQENAITSKLDIAKFKDPKFVASFTTQYLIAAGNAASSSTSSSLDSLAASARSLVV